MLVDKKNSKPYSQPNIIIKNASIENIGPDFKLSKYLKVGEGQEHKGRKADIIYMGGYVNKGYRQRKRENKSICFNLMLK